MTTHPSAPRPLGILINPVSGRDVRRLAARAGTSTPEDKRNQVQRVLVGAAAAGVERAVLTTDPFRIARSAIAALGVPIDAELLDLGGRCDPRDTPAAAEEMRRLGCGAIVVLGGDGTNRQVAKVWPDAPLVPMSTGTNNVFPSMLEATTAGAAAGLVASGRVPLAGVSRRAKVVAVDVEGAAPDIALIDAVHLVEDELGNRMPVEPDKLRRVVLARAEPCAVGMSPIGGLLHPTGPADDRGVDVECVPVRDAGRPPLLVPISPGLYAHVGVRASRELPLGEIVEIRGPGLLAFDGDREIALAPGQTARLRVERAGPRVIDVGAALTAAAANGSFRDGRHWHDHRTTDGLCC